MAVMVAWYKVQLAMGALLRQAAKPLGGLNNGFLNGVKVCPSEIKNIPIKDENV